MSLASFNMFVGGGIGTFVNGRVLDAWGFEPIFIIAASLILLAGVVAGPLLGKIAKARSVSAVPDATPSTEQPSQTVQEDRTQ